MPTLVPAAIYVRMSTEEQPNSIVLQQDAIQRYAAAHGYEVIKAYADPGKSGITFKRRPGLQQLIRDVVGGAAPFKVVLVSDVSRWGRFQDVDESAHYEFLCRSAGVPVHYCAEQFQNDGTIQSDILKALKRTMAAEYSRELAAKVYSGLRLITTQGFHGGGRAVYGLRRMLLSTDGRRKQILERHERKNLRTERVILVPGSDEEVECIRTIFTLAAEKQKKPWEIAERLNRAGMTYLKGLPWHSERVRRILKNEKYMGWNVWGKTKQMFGSCVKKVPRSLWVTNSNAFVPLVSREQFARVQELFQDRDKRFRKPDSCYLDELRRIWAKNGKLTQQLIQGRSRFSDRAYRSRFGSLLNAYHLIGYDSPACIYAGVIARRKLHDLRLQVLARLAELFPTNLRVIQTQGNICTLELDTGAQVAVHVCAPRPSTLRGLPRWMLQVNGDQGNSISLLCFPNRNLDGFRRFYVLPELGSVVRGYKKMWEGHRLLKPGKRLNSLSQFYEAAQDSLKEWDCRKDLTRVGDAELSARGAVLSISGERFNFGSMQASILRQLMQNAGQSVSIEALARLTSANKRKPVIQQIFKIRRKLGRRFRNRIVAMEGKGYMYASTPCSPNEKASGVFN